MTDPIAPEKLTGLRPFYVMEITARSTLVEASGRTVSHLESGEPGRRRRRRCGRRSRRRWIIPQKYTHSSGQIELRQALVDYYRTQHRVEVDAGHIMATMGSSSGFILAFLGAFGRNAKIAVTRPGYPAYLNTLDGLGMQAVEIPITAESGWRLTAADVEAAYAKEKFDGLLFASPANPTGAAVTREALREIVEVCAEARRAADLGRDLSRARLSRAVGLGAGVHARRDHHQQLLQILLHDRLAHRLDGAA